MGPVPSAYGAARRRPARDDVGKGEPVSHVRHSGAARKRSARAGPGRNPVRSASGRSAYDQQLLPPTATFVSDPLPHDLFSVRDGIARGSDPYPSLPRNSPYGAAMTATETIAAGTGVPDE